MAARGVAPGILVTGLEVWPDGSGLIPYLLEQAFRGVCRSRSDAVLYHYGEPGAGEIARGHWHRDMALPTSRLDADETRVPKGLRFWLVFGQWSDVMVALSLSIPCTFIRYPVDHPSIDHWSSARPPEERAQRGRAASKEVVMVPVPGEDGLPPF